MGREYGLNFRLVEEKDAQFIVELRTMEKQARYLHPISNDLSEQIEWIKKYKDREKEGCEYYYVFEDNVDKKLGVSRLYDIHGHDFTVGSWIFRQDALFGAAILGDIIVREIGFTVLKKQECLFDVRKGNTHVIKYHMRYNPVKIGEDELNYYFKINQESFENGKMFYFKLLGIKLAT
jgi:hypothetical protein